MASNFISITKIAKRSLLKKNLTSQRKVEPALLQFGFLPNEADAKKFANHFLQLEERVLIIAFTPENFSICASDLTFKNDVDAVLFIDLQLEHPEIWLCAEDECVLNDLFDAHLQVFLMSCARHRVSVHLRTHIDYEFFTQYFLTEEQ